MVQRYANFTIWKNFGGQITLFSQKYVNSFHYLEKTAEEREVEK